MTLTVTVTVTMLCYIDVLDTVQLAEILAYAYHIIEFV